MQALQDHYPVFEANQVLTNAHLNQIFDYLDEQQRLTRANLIGIGIVCGLELRVETQAAATIIHLSKGCGVTSEGYLLLEPEDVTLVSYRENFRVPPDPGYAPFLNPATQAQYPLWELFPAGEPNTSPLASPGNFLADKVLLLFLELKKEDLRNCSPVNCDDKGASVTTTVRRLLVTVADLARIVAAAHQLGRNLTGADLETALLARLNLPDLRLPRYDVPNTYPVTSEEVLGGFHAAFYENRLVQHTADALTAAYQAFKPVVETLYATNPFADFVARFGFLDAAPTTTAQVRFLQYYYDFFGDLLQAYEEFRWKGAELLCACCPDESLFPRHLMVGALVPQLVPDPTIYRQRFLGSAAVSDCEEHTTEAAQLFRRLVEMIARFTHPPPLTPANVADEQIRIVPSKLADVPLSEKAIPHYYLQTGTPPLFQLWSPQKTRRNRANQNLSYRANEYLPTAPAFVTNPLRYDLEPYNFLSIAGHLGKNYQNALRVLLALKARHRLPIDIIALRTGAFDEKMPLDLSKESAHFQDLETLYDTIREEILSSLAEGARLFYSVTIPRNTDPEGVVQLPLLKRYMPGLRYERGTVGAWFERNRATLLALPYIDVDQARVSDNTIWTVFCLLFQHAAAPPNEFYPHVVAVYYFSKLAELLPASLSAVGFENLENRYEDLLALARYFRSEAVENFPTDLAKFLPQEEVIDHFDQVLYSSRLEPLRAVRDEYKRRLREVKQQQFLGYFLRDNPGIQHKAGVPMGGTFILVYHDDPDPVPLFNLSEATRFTSNSDQLFTQSQINLSATALEFSQPAPATATSRLASAAEFSQPASATEIIQPAAAEISRPAPAAGIGETVSDSEINQLAPGAEINQPVQVTLGTEALFAALKRISTNAAFRVDPDVRLVLSTLTGAAPDLRAVLPGKGGEDAAKIIRETVDGLADGTVIADFYLPYLFRAEGGVQFVLPKSPPTFTVAVGCSNADQRAEVTLTPEGGMSPYSYKVDGGEFQPLRGSFLLAAGRHQLVIRDAEARESAPQPVVVAATLALLEPRYECVANRNEYVVTAQISGGTAPYTASRGTVTESRYVSDTLPGNQDVAVTITDSRQCLLTQTFNHSCLPPLAFTTQVGCTTANQVAPVAIRPTGGRAPYMVRVGSATASFQPVTDAFSLPVGTHTVVVRDSEGAVTTPQTVVVLPPLVLTATAFECQGTQTYRATIEIRGGLPPYTFNGQRLTSNVLTTEPTPSGRPVRVEVTDQNNCSAQLEVTHTCAQASASALPCDGVSRSNAYRLWVQPSPKDNAFRVYDPGGESLAFRYKGTDFSLPLSLVNMSNTKLSREFDTTVAATIEKLNKAIADKIGSGLVKLNYQRGDNDPFALLRIEHFVCETFSLSFDYSVGTPEPVQRLNVQYTNENDASGAPFDGVVFLDRSTDNQRTSLPAFDGAEINQTNGSTRRLCELPKIELRTEQGSFPQFSGTVTNIPEREVSTWIWEFPGLTPNGTVFLGKRVSPSLSQRTGRGRLTVITTAGCFGTVEFDYDFGNR
ncbi:hypothetical protein IC235_00440 [Hymenobacter sp. BT664]|uniref:Uncharacterized protein n=1 Tax=Hymenobacter montanus TaxID=2771359 RepID=A0A927B919_9BACT|nr:hypothetical protein [Hymenobacter montanus]MBD2766355.1 hypothetical protein [Hymenobacter montanus]